MISTSSNRERTNGTPEFYRARAVAFALIRDLEVQDDRNFQFALMEARDSQVVRDILQAQGRLSLLSPCFDIEDEEVEQDVDFGILKERYMRRFYSEAHGGIVTITVSTCSDCEGSSYERTTTLNGFRHDVDGPARTVRKNYHIPEEKHLNEDYVQHFLYGLLRTTVEDYAALSARLSHTEALYYGWADDAALAVA
ncbi:hypothetical protein [Niveispirillum fermenti]|uniref:hypothetical protein n=1 Tax=Niveispirillum fermenti TaxID=1233113 RepID=UPI003A8634BD